MSKYPPGPHILTDNECSHMASHVELASTVVMSTATEMDIDNDGYTLVSRKREKRIKSRQEEGETHDDHSEEQNTSDLDAERHLFREKEDSRSDYIRYKSHKRDVSAKLLVHKRKLFAMKVRNGISKCEPHSGVDASFLTFMAQVSGHVRAMNVYQVHDNTAFFIENIMMLIYSLCKAQSFSDYVIAAVNYIKLHINCSLTTLISDLCGHVVTEDPDEFSDIPVMQAGFEPRALLDAWDMWKTHPIFPKISYLITAAMASSICNVKNISFDIAGIKIIELEALKVQASAFDMIDAAIATFTWITETGWCCIKEKSLLPILYADQRIAEYTKLCNEVIAYKDCVKAGNIEEMSDYENKVDRAIKMTCELQKVTPSPAIKELHQRKYAVLVDIKQDIIAKRKHAQYRMAPIGWSISGESSIGKSDVAAFIMKVSLNAMGYAVDPDRIITLSDADKYHSTYTSDVLGVYIDDANNANSQFVEGSPTQTLITFFNNVAAQAVKAELSEKGCVFIDFKVGVLTTNTKDLGANIYSNYPVAVLRRFNHITARVKQEYRVREGNSLDVNNEIVRRSNETTIVDVWEFDLEEVVPNGTTMGAYRTMSYVKNGVTIPCRAISLETLLEAVIYFSKEHKARQTKQVARNTHLMNTPCCTICGSLTQVCHCNGRNYVRATPPIPPAPRRPLNPDRPNLSRLVDRYEDDPIPDMSDNDIVPEQQSIWERKIDPKWEVLKIVLPHASSIIGGWVSMFVDFFFTNWILHGVLKTHAIDLLKDYLLVSNFETFVGFLPRWIAYTRWFEAIAFSYRKDRRCLRAERFRWALFYLLLVCFPITMYMPTTINVFIYVVMSIGCCYFDLLVHKEREYVSQVIQHHSGNLLTQYARSLRRNWRIAGAVGAIGIAAVAIMLDSWNYMRKRKPHALDDFEEIDQKPNWFGFTFQSHPSKTCSSVVGKTTEQLVQGLKNNVCWARFEHQDKTVGKSNVFFPRSSVMLVPKHLFYPRSEMDKEPSDLVTCTVFRNNLPGGKHTCKIRLSESYIFPDHDLVACYIPNGPNYKSVYKDFVTTRPTGSDMAIMLCIQEESLQHETDFFTISYQQVGHRYKKMYGGSYTTSLARVGACMSPIISDTKTPSIVGFHIGGETAKRKGICQTITLSDYKKCEMFFEEQYNFLSAESGNIPESQYGEPVIASPIVHAHAKNIHAMTSDNLVLVLGSTEIRSQQKSSVVKSVLSDAVAQVCGCPNKWGSPKMLPNWKPFNVNVDLFTSPGATFDPMELKKAKDDYMGGVVACLPKYMAWESKTQVTLRPLTMRETIMGIPGIRFIDAMPMNTGAGFPLFGKKNKLGPDGEPLHFTEVKEGNVLIDRIPKQHILDEVTRMETCYVNNQRAYPVTSATLKDEATELTKDKVRVFQAAPVALGILVRKYFLPLGRFLCCFPREAELAVGINCFGKEWEEIVDHAFKFSTTGKGIAWDYSKYDVRMSAQITRAVWGILIQLAEYAGYDAHSLYIMKAMIIDICHPLVDVNGTLLMAMAMNTSGNNMTVMINSIAGSLYVRMGFYSIYPQAPPFRQCVSLVTYGDDGIGSVHPDYAKFHFKSYKEFLERHDMKLTPPDKNAEDYEMMPISEIDFLKRKSNYIPEINRRVGALEEDSIFKSLHCNVVSTSATPKEVARSCVEGALHEWFAYGREHYNMRLEQMKLVCEQAEVPVDMLTITFDERVTFWKEKYDGALPDPKKSQLVTDQSEDMAFAQIELHVYAEEGIQKPSYLKTPVNKMTTPLMGRSNLSAHKREPGSTGRMSTVGGETTFSHGVTNHTSDTCILCDILLAMRQEQQEIESYRNNYLQPYLDAVRKHTDRSKIFRAPDPPAPVEPNSKLLDAIEVGMTLEEYLDVEERMEARRHQFDDADEDTFDSENKIVPHSLSESNPISAGHPANPALDVANVGFMDAHPGFLDERDGDIDLLRTMGEDTNVSLNDFFKRPIKIASYTWAVNTNIFETLNPWQLFFENKRVINRLTNYKNLRADLHVKITINGTGLHYGRALASYQPLHSFDGMTTMSLGDTDLISATQRPCVWLNPTVSQGGTLRLPFFTPYNMLDIPSGMWRDMGLMHITGNSTLKHANAGTSGVTISVFAWAENVVLSGLTGVDCTFIVPQAASEYAGILSKPASTVAKLADTLSEIPSVARFAKATSIGAKSIGYMANLFGYSKVKDTHPSFHHIQGMDSLAVCDGHDNVMAMTVDSKNELTIDPIVGSLESKDELVIRNIASRESFVVKSQWFTANTPEQKIFNIVVDPGIVVNSGGITGKYVFPACAYASMPFLYWRGSMKYRFQFCCSSFHKGRVKFVYDPYASGSAAEYNTAYTQIVDISEQNDVTIEVGWGQHTNWRQRMYFVNNGFYANSIAGASAANLDYTAINTFNVGNGVLSVYVVSALATPNSAVNNDIDILVSVSAGEDFEVANPDGEVIRVLGYEPWPNAAQLALNRTAQDLSSPGPAPEAFALSPTLTLLESKNMGEMENIIPHSAPEMQLNLDTPVESRSHHYLGPAAPKSKHLNSVYMGETVVSYRSLLKRYNFHELLDFSGGNNVHGVKSFLRGGFPAWPQVGTYSNIHRTVSTTTAYWGKNTLIHYLTCAFGGWRGAIRQFFHIQRSANGHGYCQIHRETEPSYDYETPVQVYSDIQTLHLTNQTHWPSGHSGVVTWVTSVNPQQKIEVPYVQPYRFSPAKYGNSATGELKWQNGIDINYMGHIYQTDHITRWVAAGEDFTLLFFLGAPPLYQRPNTMTGV